MTKSTHVEHARRGANAWNKWREENPDESVDFLGEDFTQNGKGEISFAGFKFGDNANFSNTVFGTNANFIKAEFGSRANFESAKFGDEAAFKGAVFGEQADFSNTAFGEDAYFFNTEFGNLTKFRGATFEHRPHFQDVLFDGNVSFRGASLLVGSRFENSTFCGPADFRGTEFGEVARFADSVFKMTADFRGTIFDTKVDFERTEFEAEADFRSAVFEDGTVFREALFRSAVRFSVLTDAELSKLLRQIKVALSTPSKNRVTNAWARVEGKRSNLNQISFRSATFQGFATFAGREFCNEADFVRAHFFQPPDFRDTKNRDQLHWTGVRFGIRGSVGVAGVSIPTPGWTTDPNVTTALRRLRAIAQEIFAHDAQRDLFILERKAERGILWSSDWRRPWRPLVPTTLLMLYSIFSDCGRSILLPLLWLVGSNAGFHWLYDQYSEYCVTPSIKSDALMTFTLAHVVPFFGATRAALDEATRTLFGAEQAPIDVQFLTAAQGFLGALFLFLVMLAMRNHFKIK